MAILKTSTSLLLAAALLFQAACSEESAEPRRPKLHHTSWKEEVKLQDGRVILIQRNIESRMIHTDTFRPAYKPVKQEVIVLDAAGLDNPAAVFRQMEADAVGQRHRRCLVYGGKARLLLRLGRSHFSLPQIPGG